MAARGLWVTCGSYCSRHLTDGHISAKQVRKEGGTASQIRSLLDSGLWKVCDSHPNCYAFHDWFEQQPQRNDVLNRRAEDAERKRKAREAKRDDQRKRENVRPDVRDGVRTESALPDPTRPDQVTTYVSDDDSRNVAARETTSSSSSFSDGTPIPEPPSEIETASRPTSPRPGNAARTLVRQELGDAGYPHRTIDRIAVQAGRLAAEGTADDVIREAVRVWDHTPNAKPEWLSSIAGDVVQNRRSRAAPASAARPATTDTRMAAAQALKQRPDNVHPLRGLES